MSKVIFIDNGALMFRSIFSWEKNRKIPPTYVYLKILLDWAGKLWFSVAWDFCSGCIS